MDNRYPGYGDEYRSYFGPDDQIQQPSPRTFSDYRYSGGGRYGAPSQFDSGAPRYRASERGREAYGPRGNYSGQREREDWDYPRASQPRSLDSYNYDERSFFERAGDEVRSWFGDEEAERRRERDMRQDNARARQEDGHYRNWRTQRMAELDRDYDEYRRENAQRFHNEFSAWRTDRQGQRDGLGRVTEHMEVIGSDGAHIGTVDKVRGDRIVLTKSDSDAGGHHHSIPSRWIQSVGDGVTIRKTAEEAKAAWKDEERGAFFGSERDEDRSWKTDHNLNRAFPGTY